MRTLLTLLCLIVTSVWSATPAVSIDYDDPKTALAKTGAIEQVVDYLNKSFNLPVPLVIRVGGDDGPAYDAQDNVVLLPPAFYAEVRQRYIDAEYADEDISVDEASNHAMMHTLLHEFGHAIVALYDLPVVGKEEDAVDALATILLLEFFDDGEDIAISAADLFDLESEDQEVIDEQALRAEHSLDVQRFYNMACLIYGSDPEEFADLAEDLEYTEERAERCDEDYDIQLRSWIKLLKPHAVEADFGEEQSG